MANTPDRSQMSDDERADLLAMIAAGRELSPEMDTSLVDSYAERRAAEKRVKAKTQEQSSQSTAVAPQQQPGHPLAGTHPAVAIAGMAMIAAIFVVIMVFSQGNGWWMIFPLFGIFGGWMGNGERHRMKMERRAQRYQMRADYYRARMGYPPRDDTRRLPDGSEAATGADSGPLPPPTGMPTPPATRSVPSAIATSSSDEQPPINPAG